MRSATADLKPSSAIAELSAPSAVGCTDLLERRARKLKNAALRQARYRQTPKARATKERWLNDSGRAYKTKWMAEKRASSPKQIRPLTDGYVRSVLTSRSLIPPNKIPAEMVEAATANLKLKRLWQNRKT